MHCAVEMVTAQLVRGIWNSEKKSSLATEILQSRMNSI